ncbi:MAG: NAD-dependent epimerase/dehydratase family protein [Chlamydiales bacterium]|nr:NAD-dependent epimerase/dehydratase family protein [Chlamydiales bacterium]
MNILVTGARGFLGNFLCSVLESQGHTLVKVHSQNCDLTNKFSLRQFDDTCFDQIYHLAAWTQAGDFCLHHPAEQWLINQKINTNVLDWWLLKQQNAKMICMGTSCVYDPELPLEEEYYLKGQPIDSLFTYAMTKKMLLCGLQALNKQFGLNYLYLVPSTLYGPGYHTDGRQMHFIFDLIRKILRGLFYNEPVVLWGDGNQKRELVHINDFVKTLIALVDMETNHVINIGAGIEHSIAEFAREICEQVGYSFSSIQFDISKYVGAKSKVLSIKKLKQIVPEYQTLSLKEGLKETIAWFLQNREVLIPIKSN